MIGWGAILYGAGLSAVFALAAVILILRERSPRTLLVVAATALAGPIAWNAVLHSVNANDFFVDAPVKVFPVSWQDCGSGVWTLAVAGVAQGLTQSNSRKAVFLAVLTGLAAWLVDIYLY